MPSKKTRWLFWDGTYSDNGQCNTTHSTGTRAPKEDGSLRLKHKIGLSLGRGAFKIRSSNKVSARIKHMPPSFTPPAERLGIQIRLKREDSIKSLLLRIKDASGVVVYQEALDKDDITNLSSEKVVANIDLDHPEKANPDWDEAKVRQQTHAISGWGPYKPEIWVSKGSEAFQIRGSSTARLIRLEDDPKLKVGYQMPHTAGGSTTLRQAQQAFETTPKPEKRIRFAILNANTSMEFSEENAHSRAALTDEIAATYKDWKKDPLTGNAITSTDWDDLEQHPHIAATEWNSCPFDLKPEINFDSWVWRYRYLADLLEAIDTKVTGDTVNDTGLQRVLIGPEWYFNNTKVYLRESPFTGKPATSEYVYDTGTNSSRPRFEEKRRRAEHGTGNALLTFSDLHDAGTAEHDGLSKRIYLKKGQGTAASAVVQQAEVEVRTAYNSGNSEMLATAADVKRAVDSSDAKDLIEVTVGGDGLGTCEKAFPSTVLPTEAGADEVSHGDGNSKLTFKIKAGAKKGGEACVRVTLNNGDTSGTRVNIAKMDMITVWLKQDGTSTASDVAGAVAGNTVAASLISAVAGGDGSGVVAAKNVDMFLGREDTPFKATDFSSRKHGNILNNIRPYLKAEKDLVIAELKKLSARYPKWLLVPGTILWKQLKTGQTKDTEVKDQEWVVFNTAPVLLNGELIHLQHKRFLGGDTNSRENNDGTDLPKLYPNGTPKYHFSGLIKSSDWGGLVAQARTEFYAHKPSDGLLAGTKTLASSLFEADGLTVSLDICQDHGVYMAASEYVELFPGGLGSDLHLIVCAGKTLQCPNAREGGYVAVCNTGQVNSGVFQVKEWITDREEWRNAGKTYREGLRAKVDDPTKPRPGWTAASGAAIADLEPSLAPPAKGQKGPRLFEDTNGYPDGTTRQTGATNRVRNSKCDDVCVIFLMNEVQLGKPYA